MLSSSSSYVAGLLADDAKNEASKDDIAKMINLLTEISVITNWKYFKPRPAKENKPSSPATFRLNGAKEKIVTAYEQFCFAAGNKISLANVKGKNSKITSERLVIEGFTLKHGILGGKKREEFDKDNDYLMDICFPIKEDPQRLYDIKEDLQRLHDILVPYKNAQALRKKNVSNDDSADSKSEKETDCDINLRIYWEGYNNGKKVTLFIDSLEDSATLFEDAKKPPHCLSFKLGVMCPGKEIYIPYVLLNEAFTNAKKAATKTPLKKNKKMHVEVQHDKMQPYGIPTDSTNPFFEDMKKELDKITDSVKHYFCTTDWIPMHGGGVQTKYVSKFKHLKEVEEKLIKNGLNPISYGFDEISKTYVFGVDLFEVYARNFRSPVKDAKQSDQKTTNANLTAAPTTNSEPKSTLASTQRKIG